MTLSYTDIWVGEDPEVEENRGNTILIREDGNNYVLIADVIIRFDFREPIIGFESPVGNSDVPYPFAWTEDSYVLFPRDRSGLVAELIRSEEVDDVDPYETYYSMQVRGGKIGAKFRDRIGNNVTSSEIIGERLY